MRDILEIPHDAKIYQCDSCDTVQALPREDDDSPTVCSNCGSGSLTELVIAC